MIQIGTVIQGYKVYGICDKYCIARNISPRTADSWERVHIKYVYGFSSRISMHT